MTRTKAKITKFTLIQPGIVQSYGSEVSGRCHRCNIRFIWPRKFGKLSEMHCVFCGNRLEQTTHLFQGRTYRLS